MSQKNHSEIVKKIEKSDVDAKMKCDEIWSNDKKSKKRLTKTMLKMKNDEVTYVDYHQENTNMSTSYTMTSRLSVIRSTRRRFIAKDILISLKNLKKTNEWRDKKLLFRLFIVNYLSTIWMKIKNDEKKKIAIKQKSKHKMRNSILNAIKHKSQMTQVQMSQEYQKWFTKSSSKKKASTSSFSVIIAFSTISIQMHDKEKVFEKNKMSFSTKKRSTKSRRKLLTKTSQKFDLWLKSFSNLMRDLIIIEQKKHQVLCLLKIWKNIFVINIRDMSFTDLIKHKIFTYQHIILRVTKSILYTTKEIAWQKKNISLLKETKIIMRCNFLWFSRTRFFKKSNEKLKMIHVFCALNEIIIKANQSMRKIESILRNLTQSFIKYLFKTNVANDFWAVSIHLFHAYKLDISTTLDSYCYLKMRQKTTRKLEIYSQLKNTVIDSISISDSKFAFSNANSSHSVFNHFIDDDVKEFDTLSTLIRFLHTHYFLKLVWIKFILNSKKCEFFTFKIQLLKHRRNLKDIRSNENKIEMFREYSSSTCKKKLKRFLYMLLFLKKYISGRANRFFFLRTIIVKKTIITLRNDKKQSVKQKKKFLWTSNHERVFQKIKKTIMKTICSDENDKRQWHLTIDVSKIDASEILFQLNNHSSEIAHRKKFLKNMQIVMFLSYQYNSFQIRYQIIERETLIVVKCLTKVRWLIQNSQYSIKLYTNHSALIKCLKNENTTNRIARWQLALSKYSLNIIHVSERKLVIANDLSKIINYSFSSFSNFEFTMMTFSITKKSFTTNDEQSLWNNSSLANNLSRIAKSLTTSDEQFFSDTSTISKEQWRMIWEKWLNDFWYVDIVKYKIRNVIKTNSFLLEAIHKVSKKKIRKFLLIENRNSRDLTYIERSKRYNRCLHVEEVIQTLVLLHNVCEHFSKKITQARAIEKYYWSTRFKNIFEFCRSCFNCQMLNSLKSTENLLSIVFIQSFDFVKIDYLKSISLIVKNETRFIQIEMNYMCRFLFAEITLNAISKNFAMFFDRKIVSVFEFSKMMYQNNETHFKKLFSKYLSNRKIKQIFASITHFQFVKLSKRYNRLILNCFRAILQHHSKMIFEWDRLLLNIVNVINTRLIRIYEFFSTKILFEYQFKYLTKNAFYENSLRAKMIENVVLKKTFFSITKKELSIEKNALEHRLAKLNELRNIAIKKKFNQEETLAKKKNKRTFKIFITTKCLVKLKRLSQENQHSHKLKAKWKNSYIVHKLTRHDKSLWLKKMYTNEIKKKYSINDVKLWIERKKHENSKQDWRSVTQINQQIKQNVKQWQRDRVKVKKERLQTSDHDFDEKKKTKKMNKKWWNVSFNISIDSYENEIEWNW